LALSLLSDEFGKKVFSTANKRNFHNRQTSFQLPPKLMKLELDLNSSQNSTLINHPETDSGSEDVKKMLRSGISLAKEGNRVEARQMLLGVTEVEPNNETAWLWLASISEYPEELLVFLQNVLKVNPDNERALEWAKQTKSLLSKTFVQRGISAAQNNQKDFAKQCFLQGIVHDSENEMAWLWLASTCDSQEEKVSHLQQVLRINPDNETAQSSLNAVKGQQSQGLLKKANSAAISGDHETARQTLNAIMKNSPEMEEAWILKAFLATDFYEKVECYEKALAINPECEAAQAGLASLQLLMPKMPKPTVEETKVEEVTVEENAVAEIAVAEESAPVEELAAVEEVTVEEKVEEFAEQINRETETEAVEFDENFDLEQLAAEPTAEEVEFAQEVTQESIEIEPAESRVLVEEILLERQQEEEAIHEMHAAYREDYDDDDALKTRVDSIFNYKELIAQEEALAEENQAESVLEFDQSSDNPTQELDEDFARNAAAEFGLVAQEGTVLESQAEAAEELEDFYTEQSVETEEVAPVQAKTEVKVTETYVTEVNTSEIYDSEFFANDGFVLVPQNDPFADHTQETVEFSVAEVGEVQEVLEEQAEEAVAVAQEVEAVEEIAETEQVAEFQETEVEAVEQFAEADESTEFELVEEIAEAQEDTQFEAVAEVVETQEFAQVEETVEAQEAAEVEAIQESFDPATAEVFETQPAEQLAEVEPTAEEVAEIFAEQETEQTAEMVESPADEQVEESLAAEAAENFELQQPEQVEEAEQVAEAAEVEQVAETAEAEQVAEAVADEQTLEYQETVEAEQVEQPTEEIFAAVEPETETFAAPQVQANHCPFCAAENENEAAVCHSCQAMLSLEDLEALISHQGVNQDLLLQAIEKMEVEKGLREFNAEELTFLAVAHLNAKNLEKGLNYLKEAVELNSDDAMLTGKINFLTAHLEELKANKVNTIGKNRTILVVDDSPTVRKLISGKLEKCGHSVLSAVDGMDALAKINEVIPDLILLDITMPRLDGYQVCKLIRNNEMTKDVPIVMISGKDGFFDKVRGRMAGSSGYITKPFGPDTLMKTIETYLN
jgi:CheY-like chemotaxis protein/tetratricopeptide (TPR) repeat protein